MKICIIGGGSGGYSAALLAAKGHHEVILIEKDKIGGTCLHKGCIPTKSFLADSAFISHSYQAKESGLFENICDYNGSVILENKDKTVNQLHENLVKLISQHKIEVIHDEAYFVDEFTVQTKHTHQTIQADRFIIATGSYPAMLPFATPSDTIWTSDDCFLMIPSKKENIIIIGGGVIGLELATFYRQLQHSVTIIEAEKQCALTFDQQAITQLTQLMKKQGITILTSAMVTNIKDNECVVSIKETSTRIPFDRCIIAIGRKANVESLNLEQANITHHKTIDTNDNFQTNHPHIYAIGDVTGKSWLAHGASAMAKAVITHIETNKPSKPLLIPSVIYSSPAVAMVGVSAQQAKEQNLDVNVIKVPITSNGMHLIYQQQRGFISLIIDKNQIPIGATVFSIEAAEIINVITLAILNKVPLKECSNIIFAHPSFSEPLKDVFNEPLDQAVYSLYKGR